MKQNGQGLVEYALILVLVAIVVVSIISVIGPEITATEGVVVCPNKTYTGKVNVDRYSSEYLIIMESGREVRAPKAACVFEER